MVQSGVPCLELAEIINALKADRWDDVARIRTLLNNKGMKKVNGCSSIEVDRVVHEFLVNDKVHPRCKEIYDML